MKNKILRITFLLFICKPQADIFATAQTTQLHLVHRKLSFFCHSRPFTFHFYTAGYSHDLLMKTSYLHPKRRVFVQTQRCRGAPAVPLKAITSTKCRDMTCKVQRLLLVLPSICQSLQLPVSLMMGICQ